MRLWGSEASSLVEEIDPTEQLILLIVALTMTSLGVVAGALVCWQLWGGTVVTSGFWTLLLTVSALTALPLFATTTQLGRTWVKKSSRSILKAAYVLAMLVAATATLTEVALSLYQVAVTGSGGANPNDLVLLLTTVPAGATVGAATFGVAATILDKINT
jgi:hypothetical protein